MANHKWEKLLNEATALIKSSRENIYEAVSRMVAVSKDSCFLDFHDGDMDKAIGILDDLVEGFGLSFAEVELMLHYFPAKDQWKTLPLNKILAESIVKRDTESRKNNQSAKPEIVVQSRPTARQFEAVKVELSNERENTVRLASEVSQYVSVTDQLRARIRDLEGENQRLLGRIEELERMLNRNAVSV